MLFSSMAFVQAVVLVLVLASVPPVTQSWSKEGHMLTCQIAQDLLEPAAAHAVKNLLPEDVDGDLSALCVWPDQVRHWYKYRWSSPLHFIDTPDKACSFVYSRDCHGPDGAKDMCVAGAIANFSSQLMHYKHGSADRRYNLTEALLFLSHFMGDVHQVWDREIILTAIDKLYGKDMDMFRKQLEHNFTKFFVMCSSLNLTREMALSLVDDYFDSRLPIVSRRIAQGGVRLAMFLNRIFGAHNREVAPPT
ncbi:hypothetical protein PR202_gb14217 [Eleusine coracana subsp. coracana]|uniref:Aspergillus nuclease S1 n=1 Tax=Eleusine coracana subsp. coracana TaxID=191504 RepID=A0AAV5EVQ0_ELECO|nr:hypothetical protein PR202_gb14217 [Eleusine coracana subsp. coracana]